MIRSLTAHIVAPVLAWRGKRFSKDWRWGVTRWHRIVYRCCSTVEANRLADEIDAVWAAEAEQHDKRAFDEQVAAAIRKIWEKRGGMSI